MVDYTDALGNMNGAPQQEPEAKAAPAAKAPPTPDKQLRQIQGLMRITGDYKGPVNGLSDKATVDGMTKFLKDRQIDLSQTPKDKLPGAIIEQMRTEVSTSPRSVATMQALKEENTPDSISAMQYGLQTYGAPVEATGTLNTGTTAALNRQVEIAAAAAQRQDLRNANDQRRADGGSAAKPEIDTDIQKAQGYMRMLGITEVEVNGQKKEMTVDGRNGPITSAGIQKYKAENGLDNGDDFASVLRHMEERIKKNGPDIQQRMAQTAAQGASANPNNVMGMQMILNLLAPIISALTGGKINLQQLKIDGVNGTQTTNSYNGYAAAPAVTPKPDAKPAAAPAAAPAAPAATAASFADERANIEKAKAAFTASLSPEQKQAYEAMQSEKGVVIGGSAKFFDSLNDEQKDLHRAAGAAEIILSQKEGIVKDVGKNLDAAQSKQLTQLVDSLTPEQLRAFQSANQKIVRTGSPGPDYNPQRDGPWGALQETIIKTDADQAQEWENFKKTLSPEQQRLMAGIEDKVSPTKTAAAPSTAAPMSTPAQPQIHVKPGEASPGVTPQPGVIPTVVVGAPEAAPTTARPADRTYTERAPDGGAAVVRPADYETQRPAAPATAAPAQTAPAAAVVPNRDPNASIAERAAYRQQRVDGYMQQLGLTEQQANFRVSRERHQELKAMGVPRGDISVMVSDERRAAAFMQNGSPQYQRGPYMPQADAAPMAVAYNVSSGLDDVRRIMAARAELRSQGWNDKNAKDEVNRLRGEELRSQGADDKTIKQIVRNESAAADGQERTMRAEDRAYTNAQRAADNRMAADQRRSINDYSRGADQMVRVLGDKNPRNDSQAYGVGAGLLVRTVLNGGIPGFGGGSDSGSPRTAAQDRAAINQTASDANRMTRILSDGNTRNDSQAYGTAAGVLVRGAMGGIPVISNLISGGGRVETRTYPQQSERPGYVAQARLDQGDFSLDRSQQIKPRLAGAADDGVTEQQRAQIIADYEAQKAATPAAASPQQDRTYRHSDQHAP